MFCNCVRKRSAYKIFIYQDLCSWGHVVKVVGLMVNARGYSCLGHCGCRHDGISELYIYLIYIYRDS